MSCWIILVTLEILIDLINYSFLFLMIVIASFSIGRCDGAVSKAFDSNAEGQGSIKCCVRSSGKPSDAFCNNKGVLQGELLSPILLSLYVNNFETEFLKQGNVAVELQELNSYLL